ncbi:MAG: phytoene/squalene synthase family protein [Spirochaetia bacterium]|nr:phytoene/squalene synthase family protein [Spirochaetota bacterium]MCX8097011.1 phytoene/squalene synthase family protein [Spirochaetota bacterium]MDW8111906.1 phytoene/squalene synthase family protein [Spirochaetia bacterium]
MVDPYEYCRSIMEKYAKTFYLASQRLPLSDRKHFWSIYAYCRTVDNIADELFPNDSSKGIEELERVKRDLLLSYNGQYNGEDLIFIALSQTFKSYKFRIEPFLELIEGARWDLLKKPINTIDDLIYYSRLVAGSVGAMLLPVISNEPDSLYESAYNYGVFMQIVNIIRDVGEDIRDRNRIYIPTELLNEHSISVEDIRKGIITRNYKVMIERLMEIAEKIFFENVRTVWKLKKEVRTSIYLAGIWYLEILNAVRFSNYDNLTKRNYVPKLFKYATIIGGYKIRKKVAKFLFI